MDHKAAALTHITALMDQAEKEGDGNTAGVFRRVLTDLEALPATAFDFHDHDVPDVSRPSPEPVAAGEAAAGDAASTADSAQSDGAGASDTAAGSASDDPETTKVAETFAPTPADGGGSPPVPAGPSSVPAGSGD